MGENQPLDVYLNDHMAASAAALELVERIRSNNEGTALATHLEELGRDIDADRQTLATVMERLGVRPSTPKQVAGKVIETLSRLRLNEHLTRSAHVTRLMEIETLSLGIEGKRGLWQALEQVTPTRPSLADFDLPALVRRAADQRSRLEPYRLEAAVDALAPSQPAS